MQQQFKSYQNMLNQLCDFENWLKENNINSPTTRLKEMKLLLQQLEETWQDKSINLFDKLGTERIVFGLHEASTMLNVYEFLCSYPLHNLPRRKKILIHNIIKQMLDGPFLSKDEVSGDGNVNAHSFQFELEMAASLAKKGFAITNFDDIQFDFEDYNFSVECKRFISERSVDSKIDCAHEQLEKKLKDSKARGIIALSIDKIINADKNFLLVDTIEQVRDKLTENALSFKKEHLEAFDKLLNSKVLYVIVVANIVVQSKNNNMINSFRQMNGFNMCISPEQLSDYKLMNRLNLQIG